MCQVLRRAQAESATSNTKRTTATNDDTTAPLAPWQKPVNCWQTAIQLALEFPLWAKYTMEVAAAAHEVARVSATLQ